VFLLVTITIYFVPIKWHDCLMGTPCGSVIQCASTVKLLNVLRGNLIFCVSAQNVLEQICGLMTQMQNVCGEPKAKIPVTCV